MFKIEYAYINAILADASYVDINLNINLEGQLRERMAPTIAKYIGENFTVLTSTNPALSSFDAVVWKRDSDGKIFVSMRGTSPI